ncbi:uncharacterized, partial [Tachysurus ichikawai]
VTIETPPSLADEAGAAWLSLIEDTLLSNIVIRMGQKCMHAHVQRLPTAVFVLSICASASLAVGAMCWVARQLSWGLTAETE